jgi:hypothetical protein
MHAAIDAWPATAFDIDASRSLFFVREPSRATSKARRFERWPTFRE